LFSQNVLNVKFPLFFLKDYDGKYRNSITDNNKPTLVCFWSKTVFKYDLTIRKLNKLHKEGKINVIAFFDSKFQGSQIDKRIKFPVIEDSRDFMVYTLKVPAFPSYFIVDKKGIIKYNYIFFPKKRELFKPLNPETLETYNQIIEIYN
jgi:hypothetical protein